MLEGPVFPVLPVGLGLIVIVIAVPALSYTERERGTGPDDRLKILWSRPPACPKPIG